MGQVFNTGGSVLVSDPALINSFTRNPDFPYLVSFSRTGCHWLRMVMELYFEKPSLVRAFYYKKARDFSCFHTHDMELDLKRQNVIYLYRNPVETVYSQLRYYENDIEDQARISHWTGLYARHLAKWLIHDDFTKKKTIITYEEMKSEMSAVLSSVCDHFNERLDHQKLELVLKKTSKTE